MNSLKKYLLVASILVSIVSFGQGEKMQEEKEKTKKPKHEVRIIMENFLERQEAINNSQIWYSSNFSNTGSYEFYNSKFKYGLGYNFNFNKFGIRSKLFYNSYDDIAFDQQISEINSKAKHLRFSLGLNYQKHFEKITLFIGVDVGYFKIELEQTQLPNSQNPNAGINSFNEYKGTSIEPLIGFKYFLSKHFSLGTEIRFIRDTYKGSTLVTYNNSFNNGTAYETKFDATNTSIGPKGSISLNVHF